MDNFNILSLLFGLISIGLPLFVVLQGSTLRRKYRFTIFSLSSMVITLLLQLFDQKKYIVAGDISALQDTSGSTILVAVLLSIFVIMLNVYIYFKTTEEYKDVR
ncbi:MAG: hypothetical protein GXY87_04210 [Tissierellia bacterium]|nr:hypothetical protein [Tissierellia bacterium]